MSQYPTLSDYAIYVGDTFNITSGQPITVNDGNWNKDRNGSGGGSLTAGINAALDAANAAAALTDLTQLIDDLELLTSKLPTGTIKNQDDNTFLPGKNYTSNSGKAFTDKTITFDAENDANAQFFITITTGALTFTRCTFNLIRGAQVANIFWLVNNNTGEFTVIDSGVKGTIIAKVAFTVTNSDAITYFEGHIFSLETMTLTTSGQPIFISSSSTIPPIDTSPDPIGPICFLGNTPINTDQGIFEIRKIDPLMHTINNKPIKAITKTITLDDYLVCFEKHALAENVPSDKTVMSREHKIAYNGKMIEAKHFLGKFDLVFKMKYDGEKLYNILLDKPSYVRVNNLICETLDPNNIIAKLYTAKFLKNKDIFITAMNNKRINDAVTEARHDELSDRFQYNNTKNYLKNDTCVRQKVYLMSA
jgi:hypothetical protein